MNGLHHAVDGPVWLQTGFGRLVLNGKMKCAPSQCSEQLSWLNATTTTKKRQEHSVCIHVPAMRTQTHRLNPLFELKIIELSSGNQNNVRAPFRWISMAAAGAAVANAMSLSILSHNYFYDCYYINNLQITISLRFRVYQPDRIILSKWTHEMRMALGSISIYFVYQIIIQ